LSFGQNSSKMGTRISGEFSPVSHPTLVGSEQTRAKSNGESYKVVQVCLVALVAVCVPVALACNRVAFGNRSNIACQCDETQCDQLHFEWPNDDQTYLRLTSDSSGARFQQSLLRHSPAGQPVQSGSGSSSSSSSSSKQPDYLIQVDSFRHQQQVLGYGGAFTDSAAMLLSRLPAKLRQRALDDYFGQDGLDYNLARLPIGGTDMSSRPYSCDDLAAGQQDFELRHFRLQAEDLEFKIPTIERANEIRRKRNLEPLKIMAASWSPPAWMKSNQNLVYGELIGNSSGPYYGAYARYLIRFVQEYARHNISIWAITPANEPYALREFGLAAIYENSMFFKVEAMADFLANSLVPSLIRANLTPDNLELFFWDDTPVKLPEYQQAALMAQNVRDYMSGVALHWYDQSLELAPYRQLYDTRRYLPAKYSMISTEASWMGGPKPGSWDHAEGYARNIIENLRAGSVGWIDWNLALNMSGGPTWNGNVLDAAMLVDLDRQVYYKNPMFYALGHLSRFIRQKSHVLPTELSSTNDSTKDDELVAVAAELEEPARVGGMLRRRMALVALNRSTSSRRLSIQVRGCLAKRGPLSLEVSAKSVTSLAFLC